MMLAGAYARLGQPVDGLNCLAEAAQIIETTDERCGEAELHRLRGDLLNATGDPSAAERSYHQAIAVAKLQSAKLFELRASISLARLWCKQDRRGEARDLLAPIYGWFTEGFDTLDLKEAKALLDELHARPESGRFAPISPAHGLQPPIAGLPSPLATPRVRACCEVARRHNARHRGAFEARHRPAAGSDHRTRATSP